MGGDETEERNLLFKLFLNPSVSLPCRLLNSPTQPKVIQTAEMQYGCCVRCRCLCGCVHTHVEVYSSCANLLFKARCCCFFFLFSFFTTEPFEAVFLPYENLLYLPLNNH